eukprot:SAG11_NODE_37121_length_258_cov_0.937107_1_plen_56_part_01
MSGELNLIEMAQAYHIVIGILSIVSTRYCLARNDAWSSSELASDVAPPKHVAGNPL